MLPEQRLWRAVVTQVVVDATADKPAAPRFKPWAAGRAKRREKRGLEPESEIAIQAAWAARQDDDLTAACHFDADQDEARRWLLGKVEGLELVCQFAGYDPEYIKRQGRKLAANGWKIPMGVKKAITLAA